MPTYVQADRPLTVTTPLGRDDLLLVGFNGNEAISQLFEFRLDLLAENATEVPFDKLLGQKVTVHLSLLNGKARHFSGICKSISQGTRDSTFTAYQIEVVPQLWFLSKKAQSRTFQHVTVPEILKKVLGGLDVAFEIQGSFDPRDYCVQYRETDLDFASRLMEEEGIYYYFKHSENGHTLVVADTPLGHPDLPEQAQVIYAGSEQGVHGEDRLNTWEKTQELRSGRYLLWDHCFELPHKNLEAAKTIIDSVPAGSVSHKLKVANNDKLELYDYPGGYAQRFDGVGPGGDDQPADLQRIFADNQRTVEIRMQEETLSSLVINGSGTCRQFVSGHKFALERHDNADGSYLLTSVSHEGRVAQTFRSGAPADFVYSNRFTCVPIGLPYRPTRRTRKPIVQGTQTAVVVGPPGEEICTDKYGRVKVQFPWDRQGTNDANSSCWVRVGTPWAGKQWGIVHIPRIGQEVIVDFEEGDPDRPIIIGSVYNAEMMPPYPLPKQAAISGTKSQSTKGGGGYNELIMDDTKGNELIRVHGQYDMDSTIENDLREHVLNNRARDVANDETIKVGNNRAVTIDMGNDTLTIKMGNQTTKLNLGKSETEALQSIELKVGQSSIKLDQMGVTIKGMMIDIEGQVQTQLKGLMTQVNGDAMLMVKGGITMIG